LKNPKSMIKKMKMTDANTPKRIVSV